MVARRTPDRHIDALPEDLRDRVRERAAILWANGIDDAEADRRAYELETGKSFPGPARARPRESAPPATSSRRRTGSSGSDG